MYKSRKRVNVQIKAKGLMYKSRQMYSLFVKEGVL